MAKNHGEEFGWELDVDFPSWGNTEVYTKTISRGYLLQGETPKDAYWRVATKVAQRLGKPHMASKFLFHSLNFDSALDIVSPSTVSQIYQARRQAGIDYELFS